MMLKGVETSRIMDLTIFTPTYNRFEKLSGLYESIICSMTESDCSNKVEWLIVDDGSTKDISDLVKCFEKMENLSINLIRKENGGKHTAFNLAIDRCTSDLFVCVDDDDRLTSNAIKDIFLLGEKYKNKNYGAFVGRVEDPQGRLCGKTIFDEELVSNTIEIRDKYGFWGEPEVYYTEVLKRYKFDVFENEKFLTEAYVFDRMSIEYPFVYTNDVLMIKEYLKGGLTDNNLSIRVKSPIGTEAYYYQRFCLSSTFFAKIKAEINRIRFRFYIPISKRIARKFHFVDIMAWPIALLMHFSDVRKIK